MSGPKGGLTEPVVAVTLPGSAAPASLVKGVCLACTPPSLHNIPTNWGEGKLPTFKTTGFINHFIKQHSALSAANCKFTPFSQLARPEKAAGAGAGEDEDADAEGGHVVSSESDVEGAAADAPEAGSDVGGLPRSNDDT